MYRRQFIKQSSVVSLAFLGLSKCAADMSSATELFRYGKLIKDAEGYLDLPEGFSYKIISKTGDTMSDGLFVPGLPDGMAAFDGGAGKVIIIRNHELSSGADEYGPFGSGNNLLDKIDPEKIFDYGKGSKPSLGGTTTLVYNENTGTIENEYLSLAGTNRNCAGGLTPWNSWISCEEDVSRIGETTEKDHGYNFEVPASAEISLIDPIALTDMGRFNHEALCVDPASGIVYQTEDRHDSLIYRFIPNVAGELQKGGKLQALCVLDQDGLDTRNWDKKEMTLDVSFKVKWIDIENVESPEDDLRIQGHKNGAALFARGEGMWYGNNEIYFACTNGGPKQLGQIFKYVPSEFEGTNREKENPGKLSLFAESDNKNILKNCDNLTVAPWGDIILCEDHKDAYLRGITQDGKIYTLGHNVGHRSEFAGACFSPSGKTMFVNIQGPGHTLAITGPWDKTMPLG